MHGRYGRMRAQGAGEMKMFNMRKIISAAVVACGISLVAAPASATIIVGDCIDEGMCMGSISTTGSPTAGGNDEQ